MTIVMIFMVFLIIKYLFIGEIVAAVISSLLFFIVILMIRSLERKIKANEKEIEEKTSHLF
jgi:uncharacterized membrane protein YciS (DUF1049 family)